MIWPNQDGAVFFCLTLMIIGALIIAIVGQIFFIVSESRRRKKNGQKAFCNTSGNDPC
jgi:hypothetical protein